MEEVEILSTAEKESGNNYEIVEYADKLKFRIHNIMGEDIFDEYGNIRNVLDHWHQEVEVVYTFAGNATHYIDGRAYQAAPGKLFVANSESIHKIVSDKNVLSQQDIIAVVLNIDYGFIRHLVPDMDQMYFLSEVYSDMEKIAAIMTEFSLYADGKRKLKQYEEMKLMSMMYELLYLLCRDDLAVKEDILPINSQKNLERLRGIMQYVSLHYAEPVTQHQVAQRFYFTREYFSRFFKKNTGMTFKEYLTRYRVREARKEIASTDKSILDIAVDNGFSDSRGLINAFKKVYGTTPLKYRKSGVKYTTDYFW